MDTVSTKLVGTDETLLRCMDVCWIVRRVWIGFSCQNLVLLEVMEIDVVK